MICFCHWDKNYDSLLPVWHAEESSLAIVSTSSDWCCRLIRSATWGPGPGPIQFLPNARDSDEIWFLKLACGYSGPHDCLAGKGLTHHICDYWLPIKYINFFPFRGSSSDISDLSCNRQIREQIDNARYSHDKALVCTCTFWPWQLVQA
jgi:hypothetical protein